MSIPGFDSIEERQARRWYRRRFNVALVGFAALVWWIPPWILLPNHRDILTFAFTSLLGAVLLPVGLWKAHLVGEDVRHARVSEDTFELTREVRIYGRTLYRWRSSRRRLDCEKAMAPWGPSQGDRAVIRYLPRSGLPLRVTPA